MKEVLKVIARTVIACILATMLALVLNDGDDYYSDYNDYS